MSVIYVASGEAVAVDKDDMNRVNSHSWSLSNGYPSARINGRLVYMHRMLTNCPAGMHVDHINGDRLDNRKGNLRICTNAENIRNRVGMNRNNSSGYMGVTRHRRGWVAQIEFGGKRFYLGKFSCPIDAAVTRDVAAFELFGEHASYNFPEQMEAFTGGV